MLSDLYLQKQDVKNSIKYRKRAYQGYENCLISQRDNILNNFMAQMFYGALSDNYKNYMDLKLKNTIDNKIVAQKSKQLKTLEERYNKIMKFGARQWILKSLLQLSKINKEFAFFLKHAPTPNLSTYKEKQLYKKLINQKVESYRKKSDQYLQIYKKQLKKWEICDPQIIKGKKYFCDKKNTNILEGDWLKDKNLYEIHKKLLKNPENVNMLLSLGKAYMNKGDYNHAKIILNKIIDLNKKNKAFKLSQAYNLLGITLLYLNKDEDAKFSFKKAIELNKGNISANVNLAGLYKNYGYFLSKATKIYEKFGNINFDKKGLYIHPNARLHAKF